MYEMVRQLGARGLLVREAVPLAGALVVAELFYKFHSFTLEAIAFLGTWFALGAISSLVLRERQKARSR